MPVALFSVAPFEGMVDLAARLAVLGWRFVATADAARALQAVGLPAIDVAQFNGVDEAFAFPPTLHPRMEAALSGESEPRIDLVLDIPYSLDQGDDVGGHTLLALGAKGKRLVATSPADLAAIVEQLESTGRVEEKMRDKLIAQANLAIARHYLAVAAGAGKVAAITVRHVRDLANGENPYQIPAWLGSADDADELALPAFEQLTGEAPCFTNLADLDAILATLARLHQACLAEFGRAPAIAIAAKHGNPCGAGVSWDDPASALEKALWGDPTAVWGGELLCNFAIDAQLAARLHADAKRERTCGNAHWMLHVVGAPAWTAEAVAVLSSNPARKLFANPALAAPAPSRELHVRPVRGGALVEPPPSYILRFADAEWSARPDAPTRIDLIVAWACAFSAMAGGNEVALAHDGQLIGLGGGPSTVVAIRHALAAARDNGHATGGAVFAADAFFPATDGPTLLADAALAWGMAPRGGKQDATVRTLFAQRAVAVGYLPDDIRGFCRH